MRALLEMGEGNRLNPISVDNIARAIGVDDSEAQRLTQYLADEGLVNWEMGHKVTITHDGVVETEQVIDTPERPTAHFPALNLTIHGNVVNSQLQAGTVGSSQYGDPDPRWLESAHQLAMGMREALAEANLAPDLLAAAEDGLTVIESQLATPAPDRSIIRAGVRSVRPILENLVASGMWQGLVLLADEIVR